MSLSAKELALFYGAKAKVIRSTTKAGDEIWDGLIGKTITINAENLVYAHSAELKPILRPYSDMNEGEEMTIRNLIEGSNSIYRNAVVTEQLIRWNIDIFVWIVQDKAINALELEQNPYE